MPALPAEARRWGARVPGGSQPAAGEPRPARPRTGPHTAPQPLAVSAEAPASVSPAPPSGAKALASRRAALWGGRGAGDAIFGAGARLRSWAGGGCCGAAAEEPPACDRRSQEQRDSAAADRTVSAQPRPGPRAGLTRDPAPVQAPAPDSPRTLPARAPPAGVAVCSSSVFLRAGVAVPFSALLLRAGVAVRSSDLSLRPGSLSAPQLCSSGPESLSPPRLCSCGSGSRSPVPSLLPARVLPRPVSGADPAGPSSPAGPRGGGGRSATAAEPQLLRAAGARVAGFVRGPFLLAPA